jgi:hypothetical protein
MKSLLFLFSVSIFFSSCKNKADYPADQLTYTQVVPVKPVQSDGLKKMKTFCYSCHSPTAEMDMRMAPPMEAVKMHYKEKYNNQKDFVNAIWEFTHKPEESKSLMKGAVRKFGLMPYVPYKEEDIRLIATYIYNNELEKPDWFDDHLKEKHNKAKNGMKKGKGQGHGKKNSQGSGNHEQNVRNGPKAQGKAMAIATKKELGKNLMKAISERGTAGAVDFCNIKALPITAAKEKEFNATIKRASDKPRNPLNRATSREAEVISIFKNNISVGESPEPIIDKNNDKFDFYYPITTNEMCLQCHGEVCKEVKSETYKTIKLKYPEDLAVGYNVNEVRGIWHITFDRN